MIKIYTKYFCLLSGTTPEVQDERQKTTDMEADRELQGNGMQHHESISSELVEFYTESPLLISRYQIIE
jgi:protein involved in sex pheromone biosynthesis